MHGLSADTVSLFIGSLAFEGGKVVDDRIGILATSFLSAIAGVIILFKAKSSHAPGVAEKSASGPEFVQRPVACGSIPIHRRPLNGTKRGETKSDIARIPLTDFKKNGVPHPVLGDPSERWIHQDRKSLSDRCPPPRI
jgi:hypothetical protein